MHTGLCETTFRRVVSVVATACIVMMLSGCETSMVTAPGAAVVNNIVSTSKAKSVIRNATGKFCPSMWCGIQGYQISGMALSDDGKTLTMIKDDGSSGDKLAVASLHPASGEIMNMGVLHFTGQFAPNLVTTEDEARRLVVAINMVRAPSPQNSSAAAAAPTQTSQVAVPQPPASSPSVATPHAGLGILIANAPSVAGKPDKSGAMVVKVARGSPAAKAGLKPGDIIVAFNKMHIAHAVDLKVAADKAASGSLIRLGILRRNRPHLLRVRLEAPRAPVGLPSPSSYPPLIVSIQYDCHTTVIADDNCDYDNTQNRAVFAQSLNQSLAAHGVAVAGATTGVGPHLVVTITQVGDNSIDPTGLLCGLICDMAEQATASARFVLTEASGHVGPAGTAHTTASGTRVGLQQLAEKIAAAVATQGHDGPVATAK